MRGKTGDSRRPERIGLAVLFGVLTACGGALKGGPVSTSYDRPTPVAFDPSAGPVEEIKAVQTPAEIKAAGRNFELYVEALRQFGSRDSAEWKRAADKLKSLPAHFWKEEKALAADAVTAGEAGSAARAELVRRGRVYELCKVFGGPFDPPKWQAVWTELQTLGDSAMAYAGEQLLRQLMSVQRRDAWDGVRFYLVELADLGLEMTATMYQDLAKEADRVNALNNDALFTYEEVAIQVLQVLVSFGDRARAKVREAGLHRNVYIRRASARAIGASADPTCLPLLVTLTGDPVAEVRAAAYEGMGKMRYARAKAGEAVLAGLVNERESIARESALTALGELRHRPAAPVLMGHLDRAEGEWNRCMEVLSVKLTKDASEAQVARYRKAMNDAQDIKNHYMEATMVALMKITGVKKRKPADWREWWRQNAGTWK